MRFRHSSLFIVFLFFIYILDHQKAIGQPTSPALGAVSSQECPPSTKNVQRTKFKLKLTWPKRLVSDEEIRREIARQLSAYSLAPCATDVSNNTITPHPTRQIYKETIKADDEPQGDFRLAIGFAVPVNLAIIPKPTENVYEFNGESIDYVPYPGFSGVGVGGSVFVELAWHNIALSFGYMKSFDSASGSINNTSFTESTINENDLSISQTTTHMPLLLRAELPTKSIRPSIFAGVDWVDVSDSKLEQSADSPTDGANYVYYLRAEAESYLSYVMGLGFDVLLTTRLRLPIRLYAVFNPTTYETINDAIKVIEQVDQNTGSGTYAIKSEWIWQVCLSLGLSFDIYQH